jgi:Xaa-Pro aminopeptidase
MSTVEAVGSVASRPSGSTLDVAAVQAALAAEQLDGWLLYSFRNLNPIASDLTGVDRQGGHLATRRWYYFIPATGEPRALVHAIEPRALAHLPGRTERYAGREQLEQGLSRLIAGARRIAMEYSPKCAIPYIARVDAGTVELVRSLGPEVVSSGDLVQRFSAVWTPAALQSHREASDKLHRIKDRTFAALAERTGSGRQTTEFEIQELMTGWFADEGLTSDSPPMVAAAENAGDPHYMPTRDRTRAIGADELVLVDLWGKNEAPGAVFADITWVGFTGTRVPDRFAQAFATIRDARDAAVALVMDAARDGRELHGWEVDRAAASVIRAAGYADGILHRTGHSLGESVHGNGVNMDDYETHDDRRLLAGTGFTIEPGVYYSDFGVRTEINMVMGDREAVVTGPLQVEILALG